MKGQREVRLALIAQPEVLGRMSARGARDPAQGTLRKLEQAALAHPAKQPGAKRIGAFVQHEVPVQEKNEYSEEQIAYQCDGRENYFAFSHSRRLLSMCARMLPSFPTAVPKGRHIADCQWISSAVAATTKPVAPITIPANQKVRRPESKVMEVTTSPTSRKTSPRS